jgi:adenine/guanine/hypoxanthine permease
VVVATAVSAGVASLFVGLFGNLPFGLAPGTGLSGYLTYGVVLSGVLTRTEAMTACFISGEGAGQV